MNLAEELEVQGFDEWDDDLLHDLMGNDRMGKATQQLLLTYSEILRTEKSFGADPKKALPALMDAVRKFREACVDQWRDQ